MADDPIEAAAAQAFANLMRATSEGMATVLQAAAGDFDARARREAAIAERLTATLGDRADDVLQLRQSSDLSRSLAANLLRQAKIATQPAPPAGSVIITGRAVDATGAVVAGATVRLSDRTGAARIGTPVVTDEFGEFTLVAPGDAADPRTDLFVVTEGPDKRLVSPSPTPVRLDPNAAQVVELRFTPAANARTDKATQGASGRRRRKQR